MIYSAERYKDNKYFTFENVSLIYQRLFEETKILNMPCLGVHCGYGLGDVCLEELDANNFDLYLIDRAFIYNLDHFDDLESAIKYMIDNYYSKEKPKDIERMYNIFCEVLKLEKVKVKTKKNK